MRLFLFAGTFRAMKKSIDNALLVGAALGTLVRVIRPLVMTPTSWLMSDPLRHWQHATTTDALAPMQGVDPIMYQLFLRALVSIGTSVGQAQSAAVIALFASLLSATTAWLWFFFLRELLPDNRRLALTGLLLLTWLPSWTAIFSYLMPETILLPLFGLSLFLTWKHIRTERIFFFVLAVVTWSFTALTKVIALPAALISIAWMIAYSNQQSKKFLLAALLASICLVPVAVRNYSLIGVANPFGQPALNMVYMLSGKKAIHLSIYRYGATDADSFFFESPTFLMQDMQPFKAFGPSAREGMAELVVHVSEGGKDWSEAISRSWPDWQRFAHLLGEMNLWNWFAPSWPDEALGRQTLLDGTILRWLWAPLAILVAAADLGIMLKNKKLELLPAIVLTTLFLFVAAPSGLGEGRYRKAIEGLLIANVLYIRAQTSRQNHR